MFNPADIQTGMTARDRDGENLGLVVSVDAAGFVIEKGGFFHRDYRVAFSDVSDIDRDDVYLREDLASLPGVRTDVLEARGETARHVALYHDATGALGVAPLDRVRTHADTEVALAAGEDDVPQGVLVGRPSEHSEDEASGRRAGTPSEGDSHTRR
ncbi:hypothetical protein [Myxococcus qinghaiensis]|uniref:hypothetical protein n=1 Tax=Myxococcus qinghaiensis TaxID=2906758 RepID=UPI0020A821F6|nr:hypothetical protein [Myxococcus qinghaiensis]MCP3168409.1 hypothetical protein [Myxococcus qinghaiensis]